MPYDTRVNLLGQGGIPVGIAPSGTVGTNGALSLGSALQLTYANIFLYFPAGAVFTGSPAGLYFCQMTSTSLGTVYNNLYSSGVPQVPAQLNPLVGAGPGGYTGATTAVTLITLAIPGGSLGNNGGLDVESQWAATNNVNNKTLVMGYGGSNFFSLTNASNASYWTRRTLVNRGATNGQVSTAVNVLAPGASGGSLVQYAVDSSVNQNVTIGGTLAVATDYLVLEYWRVASFFAA